MSGSPVPGLVTPADPPATPAAAVAGSRRRLLKDGVGIGAGAAAFAIVYGFTAREAGFSLLEVCATSVIVLAGAAQFAALGLLVQGVPWLGIVLLTALLNARHALYSAALAPWFSARSLARRAVAAYGLTDETFALALPHLRRLGRLDEGGYLLAALVVWIPWNAGTVVGYLGGQLLPDPHALGLDVVFAAAMASLATALLTSRRDVVAGVAGVAVGVPVALLGQWSVGVVAGGVIGPLVAMVVPFSQERERDGP
jgi:4-azaleucine resistance transporter AzlC